MAAKKKGAQSPVLPANPAEAMATVAVADLGKWARGVALQAQAALAQENDVAVVQEMAKRAEAFVAYLGARSEEGRQLGIVRTWAERRLGELLALMAERGERQAVGRRRNSAEPALLVPTTHEVLGGEDTMTPDQAKKLAARAQRLAKIPAEDVERITAEQVAKTAAVTPASILFQAEREAARRAEHEAHPPDPVVQAEGIMKGEALRLADKEEKEVYRWIDLVRKVAKSPRPEAVVALLVDLDGMSPISLTEKWLADLDEAAAALAEVRQRVSHSRG